MNLKRKRVVAENPKLMEAIRRFKDALKSVDRTSNLLPDSLSAVLTEYAEAKDELESLRSDAECRDKIDLLFGAHFQ
jgi:hypothetical protein